MERWYFMAPWCAALQGRLAFQYPTRKEQMWSVIKRRLHVELPWRRDVHSEPDDEENFLSKFQQAREALALLVAVAYVDYDAWRYLLAENCKLDVGKQGEPKFEEEIPAQFLVHLDLQDHNNNDILNSDLGRFFGTEQRSNPSAEYLETLTKIAALDSKLRDDMPGVEIEIPVRVHDSGDDYGTTTVYGNVVRAQVEIAEQWETFYASREYEAVPCGSLRCKFVQELMVAVLGSYAIDPMMACDISTAIAGNVRFSHLSICMNLRPGRYVDERAMVMAFGQVMTNVFSTQIRPPPPTPGKPWEDVKADPDGPLQLNTVHLVFENVYKVPIDLAAMFSALMFNKTVKNLSINMAQQLDELGTSRDWWRWIAYALFSRRARMHSSLKSLALLGISSMSAEDVEAFSSVLASEHPEEELFGLPRGLLDESDATLLANSVIHLQGNAMATMWTSTSSIEFVRTFSDDGNSKWVSVLIPGYGRCQVLRIDLMFSEPIEDVKTASNITALTIEFQRDGLIPTFDDLPSFLRAVGGSLAVLELSDEINQREGEQQLRVAPENWLLECCPKLEELTLFQGPAFDMHFNFKDFRARNKEIPASSFSWHASSSGNDANLLVSTLERVRLRFPRVRTEIIDAFPDTYSGSDVISKLPSLFHGNDMMEYVELVCPSVLSRHLGMLRECHLAPLPRPKMPLSIESKIAFLSLFRSGELGSMKKRRGSRQHQRHRVDLPRLVLSLIFAFAAPPVL